MRDSSPTPHHCTDETGFTWTSSSFYGWSSCSGSSRPPLYLATFQRRVYEFALVLFGFGPAVSEQVLHGNITLFMIRWYRGTTRGFEISWFDFLGVTLLLATLWRAALARPSPRILFWPPGLAFLLALFTWAALSVWTSYPQVYGVFELSKMVRGILCFLTAAFVARDRRSIELITLGLGGALLFEAWDCLWDRYREGLYRTEGTLMDPNSLSEFLLLLVPMAVAAAFGTRSHIRRAFYGLAAAAGIGTVILTLSRTGMVVVGVVTAGTLVTCTGFKLIWTRNGRRIMVGAAAFATLLALATYTTVEGRFHSKAAKHSTREQYYELAAAIVQDHPLGIGLNNWSYVVTNHYAGPVLHKPYVAYPSPYIEPSRRPRGGLTEAQAPPAHSIFALQLGELGYPGLILFVACLLRWLWNGAHFVPQKRRQELGAYFAIGSVFAVLGAIGQGFTEWVYRQSEIYLAFHVIVGAAAGIYWRSRVAQRRTGRQESGRSVVGLLLELSASAPESPTAARGRRQRPTGTGRRRYRPARVTHVQSICWISHS